jgi:hypothetical protein
LVATVVFGAFSVIEYEGPIEDDYYPMLSVLSLLGLLAVAIVNVRRQDVSPRP